MEAHLNKGFNAIVIFKENILSTLVLHFGTFWQDSNFKVSCLAKRYEARCLRHAHEQEQAAAQIGLETCDPLHELAHPTTPQALESCGSKPGVLS